MTEAFVYALLFNINRNMLLLAPHWFPVLALGGLLLGFVLARRWRVGPLVVLVGILSLLLVGIGLDFRYGYEIGMGLVDASWFGVLGYLLSAWVFLLSGVGFAVTALRGALLQTMPPWMSFGSALAATVLACTNQLVVVWAYGMTFIESNHTEHLFHDLAIVLAGFIVIAASLITLPALAGAFAWSAPLVRYRRGLLLGVAGAMLAASVKAFVDFVDYFQFVQGSPFPLF